MRGLSSGRHHILGVRHPTISKGSFGKPKGAIGQGIKRGQKPHFSMTTPHNRASSSTNIPRGGHKVSAGTTIPRLPKQMSVKDILHIKFPGK
jgi:hypothetical protein